MNPLIAAEMKGWSQIQLPGDCAVYRKFLCDESIYYIETKIYSVYNTLQKIMNMAQRQHLPKQLNENLPLVNATDRGQVI